MQGRLLQLLERSQRSLANRQKIEDSVRLDAISRKEQCSAIDSLVRPVADIRLSSGLLCLKLLTLMRDGTLHTTL